MKTSAWLFLITLTVFVFFWKTSGNGNLFLPATGTLLIEVFLLRGLLLKGSAQSVVRFINYSEIALGGTVLAFLFMFMLDPAIIGPGAAVLILPTGILSAVAAFLLEKHQIKNKEQAPDTIVV